MTNRNVVREIRRERRRPFSAEDKIRIVLEGLWGEIPVSELGRREGIPVAERSR
jgi:transposase